MSENSYDVETILLELNLVFGKNQTEQCLWDQVRVVNTKKEITPGGQTFKI